MVKFGFHWDLAIKTLDSLGAEPDGMWPHLQTSNQNQARARFDREVSRIIRELDCSC